MCRTPAGEGGEGGEGGHLPGWQGMEQAAAEEEAALAARVTALEEALAREEAEHRAVQERLRAVAERAARKRREVAEAKRRLDLLRKKKDPAWRDWGNAYGEGLPAEVMAMIAEGVVAQTEAGWAAERKEGGWSEGEIQQRMAWRKRDGNCLFVFARVCKLWRKAQLEVGGPLRTRVDSDVILPGSVALAKWALAEGCPREDDRNGFTMAHTAALHGHMVLVRWLIQEQGFAMDRILMAAAAGSGNLELVQWLQGEDCPEW